VADLWLEFHGVFGDELILLRGGLPISTHVLSLRQESYAFLGPTRGSAKNLVNNFQTYLNEVDKSGIVVYFEYVLEYFRARLSQLEAIVLE
jgi:hypothetical protein